ncbi:MAG: hypothetical protein GKR77_04455, partial [Legionellales bacterium]|nr:hypothetical protein [Legionellales bacterium]
MMDISVFLIIGLFLSGLFTIFFNRLILLITLVYWGVLLLWSANFINPFTFHTVHWVAAFNIYLSYHIDGLSKLFVSLISGIGILIFSYASIYLQNAPTQKLKLLSLLQVFAISMLIIVITDDMIMFFLGWELTTITSYLLIQ